MKRFTLIVALVLMVTMPMMAERVTPETARKAASTFLNNNGAKASQLIDISEDVGFANLYVFTAEQGFVVMSADNCVQPVLGYSFTGKFVAENMPSNVRGWLQGYNDEIQFAIDNKRIATSDISQQWQDLTAGKSGAATTSVIVDALLQTTWDQNPYYNSLCPYISGEQTVTGCAATAIAQIMRYWEYPTYGSGSHSYTWNGQTLSANFGATTYDWANMPLSLGSSSTQTQINAVATLMYHCGVALEMVYGLASTGGSSASVNNIPSVLVNYFNYRSSLSSKEKSAYSDSQWIAMLKADIDAHRPVQYNGWGSVNYGGGHSFVCDGYDSNNYFHFNWGWSGNNDGFYTLTNLVPGSGGAGGGSYSFTYNQLAIFGIEPLSSIPAPTNFTLNTQGRNVILTWTAVTGAQSYNIYRNGTLIGNTSSTTYNDLNLEHGTYSYCLRSKDANGLLSTATGNLTTTIDPIAANLTVTQQGNGASLTWNEPSPSSLMLTYGSGVFNGAFGYETNTNMYVGHRYPTSMLYSNQTLTKVSFVPNKTGNFHLVVCTSAAGADKPQTCILDQATNVTSSGSWFDIYLSSPITINPALDLWVFIWCGANTTYPFMMESSTNSNGDYYTDYYDVCAYAPFHATGCTLLIRAYLNDGAYSYVLYDNNVTVAQNISGTSYTLSNIAQNTAHRYTLKTNFRGSLTASSNMAGLTVGTATLENLGLGIQDKMTLAEGSSLTVSGTLNNTNAANLVLKNNAQLTHNSADVKATLQKSITGYTDDGGWYTIATPFASYDPSSELATTNYDLYAYAEAGNSNGMEWVNYKSEAFNLTAGTGYLYAHNPTVTLAMSGTLNSGNYSTTVNLGYSNTVNSLRGYNLLGNPTAHDISFTKSEGVSDGYYYLNNSDSWVYSNEPSVPATRGFLVKANAADQTVTINPQRRGEPAAKGQYLSLAIGDDKTYVKLNEGVSMPLLDLNGQHASFYLTRDKKSYVMLVRDDATALDLNYEPRANGKRTLTVDVENLDLDYLHLIDNLTGNNVDLLTTPSYSFDAKTSDYASRFRLVFAPVCEVADNDSEMFAFVSNGNIIITDIADSRDVSLQVVDMTGRIVVCRDGVHTISTNGMTPGIYVLRVTSGEKVKTQRIVIE